MSNFLQEVISTSVVSTGLLAFALWLAREFIAERLKRSVQFEFETKLEAIRADAREREARLVAELKAHDTRLQMELRSRDQQLQLLQNGVLSARASREAALDARRLDAIDSLWASYQGLAPLRAVAQFMQTIKYDAAMNEAATSPMARSLFADFAKYVGVTADQLQVRASDSPWKSELYVTDDTWKLFEAYRGVLHVQTLRLKQLEAGLAKDFTKVEKVVDEVKSMLPHQAKFLDEHGGEALPYLVEELGLAFERTLKGMLNNAPRDEANLTETAALLGAAEKVIALAPVLRTSE